MKDNENRMKIGNIMTDKRQSVLTSEKPSQKALALFDSTSPENEPSAEEKAVRERVRASEEYVANEVDKEIEKEEKKRRKKGNLEQDKKKQAFIVNDEKTLKEFKRYCYLHELRIQDVFEVLIADFVKDPKKYKVEKK